MGTTFRLGNIEITAIADLASFDIAMSEIFPQADEDRLTEHKGWLEPLHIDNGIVRLAMRSWLLRDGERTILIDTCVGNHKERPSRPEWHRRTDRAWLAALAGAGVAPQDIDIVLCTHLHADHVGWNTRLEDGRWVPTFANARYITSKTEYRHWQRLLAEAEDPASVGNGCLQDSVLPVMEAGRMDLVDDGWALSHGLTLELSPGHTPGHLSLNVERDGGHGIFCGDAIHSPVQILEPEWCSAFCTDPPRARTTRRTLLERVADTQTLLVPAHFHGAGYCRVKGHRGGFLPQFTG